MKKSILFISVILVGLTAFRLWRIHDEKTLFIKGKAPIEPSAAVSPVHKWSGALPAPPLNAVFGIVPETKDDLKKEKASQEDARTKSRKGLKNKAENAGEKKALPQVFGVFSEAGKQYALLKQEAEKGEKKTGEPVGSPSQPGYMLLSEGGEVNSFLLTEILRTRLLFKGEGEEDRLVTLFQYDEKFIKGGEKDQAAETVSKEEKPQAQKQKKTKGKKVGTKKEKKEKPSKKPKEKTTQKKSS